jgi:hypothetical protein
MNRRLAHAADAARRGANDVANHQKGEQFSF